MSRSVNLFAHFTSAPFQTNAFIVNALLFLMYYDLD